MLIFMKIAVCNRKYVPIRIIWFRFYGLTFTMWLYNFLCTCRFSAHILFVLINFTFIEAVAAIFHLERMWNMKLLLLLANWVVTFSDIRTPINSERVSLFGGVDRHWAYSFGFIIDSSLECIRFMVTQRIGSFDYETHALAKPFSLHAIR